MVYVVWPQDFLNSFFHITKDRKVTRALPHIDGRPFLTDSGLETTLIFHEGIDIPLFASFQLLANPSGRTALRQYFDRHAKLAVTHGMGFIADTPTWRASPDWGAQLGFGESALADMNRAAVEMMFAIRSTWETLETPVLVSGNVGPRGDGYAPDQLMEAGEAETYHSWQVRTLAEAGVDFITVMTMTHVGEAIGIARAAKKMGVEVSMGLTVETDGRLPTGQPLGEAIKEIDASGAAPAYFMVNCAHPDHFRGALIGGDAWRERIHAVRANASRQSHAELDEATELDAGSPTELAQNYAELKELLPNLCVFGGCCGTDHRHIEAIAGICADSVHK